MIDLNGSDVPHQQPSDRLAKAARRYAGELGLPVFPCRPREKTPLTAHGVLDASMDDLQVTRWWRQWPDANIGLATGAGILVLDIDGAEGELSLAALLAVHGPLPDTPEQTTGKGRHLVFSVDGEVRNTSRKLGAGLDTRGDGGYVIVAPSIHPSGKRYAWVEGRKPSDLEIAPAPAWLLAGLTKPKISQKASEGLRRPDPSAIPDAYVRRAVDGEFQKVAQAVPGSRNGTINEAAFALGQLVGAGVLDEATASRTLEAAAEACGALSDEREKTLGTIARGIAAGIENPRDLSGVGRERSRKHSGDQHSPHQHSDRSEAPRVEAPEAHGLAGQWIDDIAYSYEPELIEGLIPAQGVGVIFGPSSAGKSFVTVDWAMRIASGGRVLDRFTEASGVLYFAAEGQGGLRKRLVAARQAHGLDEVVLPLNYLPELLDLSKTETGDVERLCLYAEDVAAEMKARGAPLRIVVIDTLAAAAPSADENTQKDMGPVMLAFHRMARRLNAVVVLVAHTGKDVARGLRGWSGIRANADFAIECRVEKDEDTGETVRRSLWFEKAKDGRDGFTLSDYALRVVEMGRKRSGEPDTTCRVEYVTPAAPPATGSSVADTIEAQERETRTREREQILDECIRDGITTYLTDNWISMAQTIARLREQAGIKIARDTLVEKLRAMTSDVPDDIVRIERTGAAIEIRTTRPSKRSQPFYDFRVVREGPDGEPISTDGEAGA